MPIYPPDTSKKALAERKHSNNDFDGELPDFEMDAALVVPTGFGLDEPNIRIRVEVLVGTVTQKMEDFGEGREGEPLFHMRVKESTLPSNAELNHVNNGAYWLKFSKMKSLAENDGLGDWDLWIAATDRQAMLVWWDEHGEKVIEKAQDKRYDNPRPEDVARLLKKAGIGFGRERSGGADWSVDAWAVSVQGDTNVYLVDDEDQIDGVDQFALIHRDMNGDDEITEITKGSLREMIDYIERAGR